MQNKKFSDLSPRGKVAALVAIAVSLVIIGAAQRDLQQRPDSEIRGQKLLWRFACLNAMGALVYFRWGRRKA
jgi:hypothetical protein